MQTSAAAIKEIKELAAKARALADKEGISISAAVKRLETSSDLKQSQPPRSLHPTGAQPSAATSESTNDSFYAYLMPIGDGVFHIKKIKTEK